MTGEVDILILTVPTAVMLAALAMVMLLHGCGCAIGAVLRGFGGVLLGLAIVMAGLNGAMLHGVVT